MAKSNLWVLHSFRPRMSIIHPMKHPLVKELFDAYENGTIEENPRAKKFNRKDIAWACLDSTKEDIEKMTVMTADEDGDFITDDPILAHLVAKELDACNFINHPLTKKPVKWELDKSSRDLPTEAEIKKLVAASKETK